MSKDSAVRSAKRYMHVGFIGLCLGGAVFLWLAISTGPQGILGGVVGWALGFGTIIYVSAWRAIAVLESQLIP